jgi:hypothetical protein
MNFKLTVLVYYCVLEKCYALSSHSAGRPLGTCMEKRNKLKEWFFCIHVTVDLAMAALQNGVFITQQMCHIMILFHNCSMKVK